METINENEKGSHYGQLEGLCDGRIRTEDGSVFLVHRVVLSANSDYFKGLFCSSFNKNPPEDILVKDISQDTLRDVLRYIYTGIFDVNPDNIYPMLVAADRFLLDDHLIECCGNEKMISPKNCVQLLNLSKSVKRLGDGFPFCYRYIQMHFDLVNNIDELPFDTFECLLSENSLNVKEEDIVWNAIAEWISKKPDERSEKLPELLLCLKFDDTTEELIQKIVEHPFFLNNKFCSKLLHWALEFYNGSLKSRFIQAARDVLSTPLVCDSRHPKKRFLFVKSYENNDGVKTMRVYLSFDEDNDRWCKVGERPHFEVCRLISMGHLIFVFGKGGSVCCGMNIVQKMWFEIPHICNRTECTFVKANMSIYGIGTCLENNFGPISTVEKYDYEKNQWAAVSSLLDPIRDIESVTLNDRIYTLGYSYNEDNRCVMCRVYDPQSDRWTHFSHPEIKRQGFQLIAFQGNLYAIGGYADEIENKDEFYNIVERYDALKDTWMTFKELPKQYNYSDAKVINGILMVDIANRRAQSGELIIDDLPPAVYWDEANKVWQMADDISYDKELFKNKFCVIDDALVNKELMGKHEEWLDEF